MLNNPLKFIGLSALAALLDSLFSKLKQQGIRLLLLLSCSVPNVASACVDLSSFYPGNEPDWPSLQQQLAGLMSECLESSEFFALYGAAQLNSGQLAGALESLERAILINPENGGARIDYAQALFEEGQLFLALEINEQLLQRTEDLPAGLESGLRSRQQNWQALTRQTSFQADLLAGYDNNLNGAPDPGQITLTLSGEPILLNLNEEFRPISGPYLNMQLGARHRQLRPEYQHNWSAEVRSRSSEDSQSDLLQLASRYAFIKPDREHAWQADVGINHLFFGGNPLFTGTETGGRYQPASGWYCKPNYSLALQHQLFHQENRLNAFESKVGVGISCPASGTTGTQSLSAEVSLLNNKALKSGRLGGDRQGWQLNLNWQLALSRGVLRAQLNYTKLEDRQGYSPLLANGAERRLGRSYVLLQYREPLPLLGSNASLLFNIYHQRQQSNIELFRSKDSTAEIGLSWAF